VRRRLDLRLKLLSRRIQRNAVCADQNNNRTCYKYADWNVAGGASTYKDLSTYVDAVIHTVISKDYKGDVLAPNFKISDEITIERIPVQNDGELTYIVEHIKLKEST